MGWWAVVQGILTVLSVAQGIKSYRQAKKLEREANQLLIQKYGTGAGIPVIYGTRRVAGTVVFADTVNNRELFVVYALCVGEVTDITNIQIGGRSIFDKSVFDHALVRKSNYYGQTQQEINNILANQNPPNKPRMVFNCHMGEDDQVADPMLVGCVPGWTSAHQLKGITYLACNFDYDSGGGMFNGLPEITCTVQGKKIYDPTKDSTVTNGSGSHRQDDTSTHEYSDNTSLVLLDYLTNSQYGKGIPYSAIDIQSFITSTNRHTTSTNVNHSATVQSIVQQQDLVTLARTSANLSVFNKIKVGNTITITGGGTTYASGIVMDKATNTRHTDGERTYKSNTPGYDIPYDVMYEIYLNNGAVQTAVDFSETPVSITINENGKRFPFNGVIDTDKTIFENVKDINANMRGIFTYTNGQYSLKIEDSESVTLSIDDDDILSSGITVNLENKADIYNIVEVEFANAQKDYELDTASYKHVSATSGQDYTYDDNGEELKLAIDMPFITSQAIAYQYARAILKRSRNNKEIAFQGTPKLLNAKVGEIISVTNSELGMNAEQYRITEMTINSDLTVQVNAIIYQSDIYGFVTPPGETIDIPDDPVDSFRVDTPTNLNFVDKDPSTGVQPYLTWNNSSNYPAYEFRVVIKDSSSNVLYDGRTKNTHFDLSGIQVANGYTAEVQAINTNRVESEVATYNFNNSVPPVQNNDLGDSSVTDSKVADISADKIDTGVLNLGTESGMAVRQGKTGYTSTTTGFWLGNDSGTPKFHIGTSSNFLKFDGSALNIQGDLTATTGLIGGWTVDANSIFAGTKDVSGYTTTGITISSANNGSIHAKQFYIDSSGNANFKGSIFGGSIRADVTNPIPTDIFTRTNNQSIPTSTENGAFIDLSAGKFVFGDASKFISFNGSELDVKGVLAPTILDLTGTADTNLPSNIKATAVTDGSIGVGALKQAVWNEIDSRVGTGTGGFYVTATDNYLGEATKYITIATAPDHGTETVTLEVIINDSFGAPISFSYGNIATAIDVTLEFKKTTDSTWSTAGSTQRFYANPTPTNYITIYSIDETYSVELTSGVGNDLENGTDYDFRVVVERADTTAQQSVFKAYPGGANDSNGTPIVLEAREGSVGAGQGDLFTSQYIYHSGDADTHIEFQEDTINIDAGSVNFATFESASQNTITLKEDVILQKNLTVLGTQTTLNTQILDVEDNNITLNYSSGDSSGSANGSGITIQDAVSQGNDASLTWRASDDKFIFSHPLRMFGQFELPDNIKLVAGDSNDLEIYHDGSNSYIRDLGTGNLRIDATDFYVRNSAGTQLKIGAVDNGAVNLYYAGSKKLETTNTGVTVTGYLATNTSGGLFLPDSAKILVGSSNDLEIYHDGSNSRILDNGTGFLALGTNGSDIRLTSNSFNEYMAKFVQNGAVELYYNGVKKLETTSTGLSVEGTGTFDTQVFLPKQGTATSSSNQFESATLVFQASGWDTNGSHNRDGSWTIKNVPTASYYPDYDLNFYEEGNELKFQLHGRGTSNHVDPLSATFHGNVNIKPDSSGGINAGAGNLQINNTEVISSLRALNNISGITLDNNSSIEFPSLSNGNINLGRSGHITLYGDDSSHHSIASRNQEGNSADDITINTYGALYIDLDSNNNNTSGADFRIGRHSANTGTDSYLFNVSGETGDVGIGNLADTGNKLQVAGNIAVKTSSGNSGLKIITGNTAEGFIIFGDAQDNSMGVIAYDNSTNNLIFDCNNQEAGRFDSSLNFLIGQQTQSPNSIGISLNNNGNISAKRSGGIVGLFNRGGTDGTILDFRKDDVSVGNIKSYSGDITIGTGDTGVRYDDNANALIPWNITSNTSTNGTISLGASNVKFKDLYLSGNISSGHITASTSGAEVMELSRSGAGTFDFTISDVGEGSAQLWFNAQTNDTGFNFRPKNSSGTNTNALYIDPTGQIGINTTAPSSMLVVSDSGGAGLEFIPQTSNDRTTLLSYDRNSSTYQTIDFDGSDIHFNIAGNDKGRWDSSGNFLVGKQSANNDDVGTTIYNSSGMSVARSSGVPLILNRKTNDGTILEIRKDGTGVGSFGAYVGFPFIGKGDTTLLFNPDADRIIPRGSNGGQRNGAIDLGGTSDRFKDLHLSGTAYIGTNLEVQGTLSAGTIAPDSVNTDTLNTESIIFDSGSTNIAQHNVRNTTTSSTSQTAIVNMASSFTSVKFQVQITDATNSDFHVTEIMLLNDGTNQYISEYGTITTGSALATFDADKTATNLRLLATPTTSNTLAYKIIYQAIYS